MEASEKRHANGLSPQQRLDTESQVLRAICCGDLPREELANCIMKLDGYAWLEPEHATVFQAIRSAVRVTGASWRHLLRAQATRMGFPDVDWARYFDSAKPAGVSLENLVDRLMMIGAPKQ